MNGFTYFNSYYQALRKLPDDVRLMLHDAIDDYMFEGIEPYFDNPIASAMFELMRPTLNTSKNRGKSGQTKSSENQNKIKPESNENQTRIKPESNENQNEILASEEKEKDKEKEREENNNNNIPPLSPQGENWYGEKRTNVENVTSFLNSCEYKHKAYIRGHPRLWDAIKSWMSYKDKAKGKVRMRYMADSIPRLLTEIVGKSEELGEAGAITAIDLSIGRGYVGITWDLAKKRKSDVWEGIT